MNIPTDQEIYDAVTLAGRFYKYRDDFSPKQIQKLWTALGITSTLRYWAKNKSSHTP